MLTPSAYESHVSKLYGHTSRRVNRQMMMELHGVKDYFDCDRAVLATDGVVRQDAQEVADKLNIGNLYANILSPVELGTSCIRGGAAMKRKNVTMEALRRSAMRSTRASAASENRAVPAGAPRSEHVERFLAGRKQKA